MIGHRTWAIAEGYIPEWSHGPGPELASHETLCVLNAGQQSAHLSVTVFFADRDPIGPYELTVEPRRTSHVRMNDLDGPERVPSGTDYACVVESDVPVVVQHTRLDSRQAANALVSTVAYAAD